MNEETAVQVFKEMMAYFEDNHHINPAFIDYKSVVKLMVKEFAEISADRDIWHDMKVRQFDDIKPIFTNKAHENAV